MQALSVKESLNFKRGMDPKTTLRIGKMQFLKPALLRNPVQDMLNFEEWLAENPLLAKELRFKFGNEHAGEFENKENLYTIESDFYCEENDIDQDDLEREFYADKKEYAEKPGEVSVTWGHLLDGSKVIFYRGGNVSGYVARKEWIKGLRESQNIHFQRGMDPRDAMDIGKTNVRKFKSACDKISDAISALAHEFNVSDNQIFGEKSTIELHPELVGSGYIFKAGFKTTPETFLSMEYRMFLGTDDDIFKEELYARYEYGFSPDFDRGTKHEFGYDCLAINSCMDDIRNFIKEFDKSWTPEFDDLEPIDEAQHFERGGDPKDALRVGRNHINLPKEELFKRIHGIAKKSPIFQQVSEIDYENKEPMFTIQSSRSAYQNSAQWQYEEFTLYLTKEEGILMWKEWNSEEVEIKNVHQFKKETGA